jgi:hypothetical protein
MKKILLIGDSIRMGYDADVKSFFSDSCEVYYPSENCRFAQYIARHLGDWKKELEIDVDLDLVHWNAGLWDTLELYEDGCITPPDFYEFYIEKICKFIKILFPKAKVIFATSTPVLEHKFLKPEVAIRRNAKIKEYNEIAIKVCKNHGFAINDLYSLVQDVPEEYYSDMTHLYTPEGTQILANGVIKSICVALNLEYHEFIFQDYHAVNEIVGM